MTPDYDRGKKVDLLLKDIREKHNVEVDGDTFEALVLVASQVLPRQTATFLEWRKRGEKGIRPKNPGRTLAAIILKLAAVNPSCVVPLLQNTYNYLINDNA